MISKSLPSTKEITSLLDESSDRDFSYPEVGATRGEIPCHYNIDHNSEVIGRGGTDFAKAKQGIRDWAPFDLPWIRVFPESELAVGVNVAVAGRIFGFWWINLCRVVYTIDEPDSFGFAYGTLPVHAESGEELFKVERSPETGDIRYEILAFSKPRHPLARLGYPFSRATQSRFRKGSIEAMARATSTFRR